MRKTREQPTSGIRIWLDEPILSRYDLDSRRLRFRPGPAAHADPVALALFRCGLRFGAPDPTRRAARGRGQGGRPGPCTPAYPYPSPSTLCAWRSRRCAHSEPADALCALNHADALASEACAHDATNRLACDCVRLHAHTHPTAHTRARPSTVLPAAHGHAQPHTPTPTHAHAHPRMVSPKARTRRAVAPVATWVGRCRTGMQPTHATLVHAHTTQTRAWTTRAHIRMRAHAYTHARTSAAIKHTYARTHVPTYPPAHHHVIHTHAHALNVLCPGCTRWHWAD